MYGPNRAILVAGPSIWNGLPLELCPLPRDLLSWFYSLLKTFLFARAGAGSALVVVTLKGRYINYIDI